MCLALSQVYRHHWHHDHPDDLTRGLPNPSSPPDLTHDMLDDNTSLLQQLSQVSHTGPTCDFSYSYLYDIPTPT